MLKEGQKLPSFKLNNQKGDAVKLPAKDMTLIYFYPKADTPGCTKESCEFQSNLKKFNKFETTVFGIYRTHQNVHKALQKYNNR